jgi:glycosyltransferase involved in cell wall biosynthesis
MMKVACIGNMNNNLFSLTRYLRDKGIDVELLLLDEDRHFMPDADTYSLDYQGYTKEIKWTLEDFFSDKLKIKVENDIEDFDFIIGCGWVPAFLNKAGKILDMLVPYGGDLFVAPFFNKKDLKLMTRIKAFLLGRQNIKRKMDLAYHQKLGIQECRFIIMRQAGPEFEEILDKLKIKGKRLKLEVPMIYSGIYSPGNISLYYDQTHWYKEFKKIRENNDLVVFHQARHVWKNLKIPWHSKSNDILIKGFADFVKKERKIEGCLICLEYGPDVRESKELIKSLNIEKNVKWFPKMFRKDLMAGISLADIGAAQFSIGGITYGTILEFLVSGIPAMGYRDDNLFKNFYDELYPMINVNSPEQIAHALTDYCNHPREYKKMAEQARLWFQKYVVEKPLKEIIKAIQSRVEIAG